MFEFPLQQQQQQQYRRQPQKKNPIIILCEIDSEAGFDSVSTITSKQHNIFIASVCGHGECVCVHTQAHALGRMKYRFFVVALHWRRTELHIFELNFAIEKREKQNRTDTNSQHIMFKVDFALTLALLTCAFAPVVMRLCGSHTN